MIETYHWFKHIMVKRNFYQLLNNIKFAHAKYNQLLYKENKNKKGRVVELLLDF